jgi:predicted metal-dependent HD superfamily phosphohydrolase
MDCSNSLHLNAQLLATWEQLLQPFFPHPTDVQQVFEQLIHAYREGDRHYHTPSHLEHILIVIEQLKEETTDINAVTLAGWFHDIVYDPQGQDNERQSANWAARSLRSLHIPQDCISEVHRLILLTQHHRLDAGDRNGQVLLDADLAILGTHPTQYQSYASCIRQEYAWLSEEAFLRGRKLVLENFLLRDRIYHTDWMFHHHETQARANLSSEYQALQSSLRGE